MTNSKYNAHTDPLVKSLKLLKIKDIFDVQCMKIWYKFVNNNVPTYFVSMFRYNRELYDIQTRSTRTFTSISGSYFQCPKCPETSNSRIIM